MKEVGNSSSESERLERKKALETEINDIDERIQHIENSQEIAHWQKTIDEKKKLYYEVSTDKERIERIEEFLEDHEMMYEMSNGEYTVTLDSILTPWGEIPKWENLSPYLQEELLKIKSENPWIQDSDFEEK